MLERLYETCTAVVGHTRFLNRVVNLHPGNNIEISRSASIGRKSSIYGEVTIGQGSVVGYECSIRGEVDIRPDVYIDTECEIDGDVVGTRLNGRNELIGEVSIGKYCAVAPRARMRTFDHPTNRAATQMYLYDRIGSDMEHISEGPIRIGHDVWICSDAKILSDVTIGDGAVIGADSVVVDDVEPYSIVAGNPATHRKYRFDPRTREQLQEIQWWDWDLETMRRNVEFFETNLHDVDDLRILVDS